VQTGTALILLALRTFGGPGERLGVMDGGGPSFVQGPLGLVGARCA
jgi:hypothetical protein